jgi:hypothetical protein
MSFPRAIQAAAVSRMVRRHVQGILSDKLRQVGLLPEVA